LATNSNINFIQAIAAGMIAIWSLRLGIYLFKRVVQKGSDSRFFEMKENTFDFFAAWYFQGLWTALTPCPLLVILSKNIEENSLRVVNVVSLVGLCIWLFGFLV
jgi:steroid 5-alpha reductase family enzyme